MKEQRIDQHRAIGANKHEGDLQHYRSESVQQLTRLFTNKIPEPWQQQYCLGIGGRKALLCSLLMR